MKNLKVAFTVALGGFESGGRYKFGNLRSHAARRRRHDVRAPTAGARSTPSTSTSGKKGVIKWKFDPGTDRAWAGDVACCGVNNRGVALWKDKMISISLDGRMFALNKATGEMVWERKVADPAIGETLTLAPLVVRDSRSSARPAASSASAAGSTPPTSIPASRPGAPTPFPGAGEPGNETWKDGKERWKHGGGSVWETATYDPETDTFYQGIGNAGPDWDPEYRPGDNKWAASVLALSPTDGKIKWGFQYTPNDPYDFDEISEHPIINAKVNGEDRKLVVHAARNGFYYALDRTNGSFVAGKQYVDQLNWTHRPRSQDRPAAQLRSQQRRAGIRAGQPRLRAPARRADACARRITAARTGSPSAYNPELNLLYIPSIEGCNYDRHRRAEGLRRPGRHRSSRASGSRAAAAKPTERLYGSLKALDPATGETKARLKLRISELQRRARDRRQSGVPRPLRRHVHRPMTPRPCRSSGASTSAPASMRPPITYSVNGKQYIAVLVGSRQALNVWQNAPELKNTATASMLYVFEQQ